MDVQELTEAMHATSVHAPLDLDRVTHDGRRLRNRRRAVVAGGLVSAVAAAAAVAVPIGLWQQPTPEAGYAVAPGPSEVTERGLQRALDFRADAPIGRPLAHVLTPGGAYAPKFYLSTSPGGSSLGALSLWAEEDGLAFGPRDVDGDGKLRRAGSFDLADLPRQDAILARVPFQNRTEPTFVGLLDVPDATRLRDLELSVRGRDSGLDSGIRLDVVPGRALVWVTATDGGEPGIDLTGFTVRDADGTVVSVGSFEPWKPGAWESLG